MEFLAGKAEWKDVRLKGSADGSHDTAFARDPLESLGAFKEDLVQRLFKSLREKYQVIVIEAFPPAFNSENGILHQLADAVVLQVRLGETRHEDLQRLLQFMDRRKIAAALMS
jgi:Mrp family chromosome partitioning ATPase